jgi:hypothetical protein
MSNRIIDRYNFFKDVKLTLEGYVEMRLEDYVAPQEDGISQYDVFLKLKLDEEGRIIITQKPD